VTSRPETERQSRTRGHRRRSGGRGGRNRTRRWWRACRWARPARRGRPRSPGRRWGDQASEWRRRWWRCPGRAGTW
jgi:hypothetical protein